MISKNSLDIRIMITLFLAFLAGITWAFAPEGLILYYCKILMSGDVETLKSLVLSTGIWGPATIIFLLVVQAVIPPIPAFVIIIVSFWIYGSVLGMVYSFVGSQLGAIATFWIARRLGRPFVIRLIGEKQLNQVDYFFDRYGVYAIFLARIVPILSVDAITYAAGASSLSFRKFMVATSCGQIPALMIFALMGKQAESFLEFVGYLIIGGAVLCCIGYLLKRRMDRRCEIAEEGSE